MGRVNSSVLRAQDHSDVVILEARREEFGRAVSECIRHHDHRATVDLLKVVAVIGRRADRKARRERRARFHGAAYRWNP